MSGPRARLFGPGTVAFVAILAACNAGHTGSPVLPGAHPARRQSALEHPWALHFVPFAVTNTGSNSVTFYKPGSAKVTARIADGVNSPKTAIFDDKGNLYVANARTITVYASGSSHAKRTIVSNVSAPAALAVNGGNLYVANQGNNTVSVFSPLGLHVATISSGINVPDAMAFDSAGNLYVSNRGPAAGTSSSVTVYAPGKTAPLRTIAQNVKLPLAVALDSSNDVYVANVGTNDVTVYKAGTATLLRTISQGIAVPSALAFDPSGDLYVASLVLDHVTMYKPGSASVALNISQHIDYPVALAYKDGVLYVSNLRGNAVTAYAPGGSGYLRGVSKGMSQPSAVALAPNDTTFTGSPTPSPTPASQMLFVADSGLNVVDAYALPLGNGPSPAFKITSGLSSPSQLLFDPLGHLFVGNPGASDILEFDPPYAAASTSIAAGGSLGDALALDGYGNLYGTTCSEPGVFDMAPPYTGAQVTLSFNNGLAGACRGMAVDSTGDLFVVDFNTFGSGDVRVYEPPITTASLAAVSIPAPGPSPSNEILAVNHAGDLFVAYSPQSCRSSGDIIDVYVPPYSGTPAATIALNNPPGYTGTYGCIDAIAFDANDDLFVATYWPGVVEFAPPYTGAPVALLGQKSLGPAASPEALALSSAGNLYVMNFVSPNQSEDYVLEFAPPFKTNMAPSGYAGSFSNGCCPWGSLAVSP